MINSTAAKVSNKATQGQVQNFTTEQFEVTWTETGLLLTSVANQISGSRTQRVKAVNARERGPEPVASKIHPQKQSPYELTI
jgi:hypothetical protein